MSKSRLLIIITILLVSFYFPKFIMGFSLKLYSLSTNKQSYYIYEYIEINAEWELYYFEGDTSFIQIQIYNGSDDLIWNSLEYSNIGFHSETWIIYIPELDLNLFNDSTQLYVKFFHFIDDGEHAISTFRQTLNITILKSELSCELIRFKDSITFGEVLNFTVRFFETGNNSVLINQTVLLEVRFNETWIFSREFSTNNDGEITLNLSSVNELNIGENELNFIINDSMIYDPIRFSYKIKVNRISVKVDIIQCEKDELTGELDIKMLYYYNFNGDTISLSNRSISIKIFQNSSLKNDFSLRTNQNGSLSTKILYKSLDLDKKNSKFMILFIFNGTKYLENQTTNVLIKLDDFDQAENLGSIQIISFSGFITSIMIVSIFFIKKKQNKEKLLADLYIKV